MQSEVLGDLPVRRAGRGRGEGHVAEIVSETSVERDLVTKRREYAEAGIPAYLVVDLRSPEGELTLYGERGEDGRYVDVAPDQAVVIRLGDVEIPVTVDDLLP